MATTPLVQKFGLQAVAGEYAGAETVLHFRSPAEELNGAAARVRRIRPGLAREAGGERGRPGAVAEWNGNQQHARPARRISATTASC